MLYNFSNAVNAGYREQGKAHGVTWVAPVTNKISKNISVSNVLVCPMKLERYWSHASSVAMLKNLTNKTFSSPLKNTDEKKKKN